MSYFYEENQIKENQAYKTIIREYVKSKLIDPLKMYPTTISDTLISIIVDRLEELYIYTIRFPEIVSPNITRLDILQAIVDQFDYTIREGSDLREQVSILENILTVYNKRGSVDTIENMWKYYGGDLPKDIKVRIPSYNIFRYNISKLSGTHKLINGGISSITLDKSAPSAIKSGILYSLSDHRSRKFSYIAAGSNVVVLSDISGLSVGDKVSIADIYEATIVGIAKNPSDELNRSGVYEVVLNNSTYSIPILKEFMLDELVAAGNRIYFTNSMYNLLVDDSAAYQYNVLEDTLVHIHLRTASHLSGLKWSGHGRLSGMIRTNSNSSENINSSTVWSGRADLFLELTHLIYLGLLGDGDTNLYTPHEIVRVLINSGDGFSIEFQDKYGDTLSITEGDILTLVYSADYPLTRTDLVYSILNKGKILSYTLSDDSREIERYLNDSNGKYYFEGERWTLTDYGPYTGYFVLGKTLLGKEVS